MENYLISFESGHYKSFDGEWRGDSVWMHFKKKDGKILHVNKDKVEYVEHWKRLEPLEPLNPRQRFGAESLDG